MLKDRCILAPTNNCADEINKFVLDKIPDERFEYLSADSVSPVSEQIQDQDILYPIEFLNTLQVSGVPNHAIELKVGVPIMLLRNANPKSGMCNGTRLIVIKLGKLVIEGQIITGSHVGERRTIPRIVITTMNTKTSIHTWSTICCGFKNNAREGLKVLIKKKDDQPIGYTRNMIKDDEPKNYNEDDDIIDREDNQP
ncbi:hypothetical protein AQUCO_00300275v1 [Aquilegia coerulea]|uniref:DNA helicase Pif1-like 2B domain-containing protein n=1 Tax=Aquilegia coerulea TaxID=218851 RepID=A0A2G5EY42_AQUCA|nr:hypothetical protein AQUCO_00300275v1 [Aquilegia coerulea]